VSVSPEQPFPGQATTIETTIRNGRNSSQVVEITDLYVRRPGSAEDVARVEDLGTVSVGRELTVPLTVSFEEQGLKNLRVIITGRDQDGNHVTAKYPVTVDVEEPDRPQLEVSTQEAVPGATRPVNVTLANGRDRDITQLQVVVSSPAVNFSVDRRVEARLRAGNTTTFSFPSRVSEAGTHPVNVTLVYAYQGVQRRISRTVQTTFDAPANPGAVRLTDLQATDRGSSVELSATAGNVGTSDVEGVVVSISETQRVNGANYFVGSIEGSDFSSFTLSTSVDGNVSTVPVEVTYVTGGVEQSFTREVDVEQAASRERPPKQDGPPLRPLVGAGVLLVVVVSVVYLWRR
jgi:hypothetical protein